MEHHNKANQYLLNIFNHYDKIIANQGCLDIFETESEWPSYTQDGNALLNAFWEYSRSCSQAKPMQVTDMEEFIKTDLNNAHLAEILSFILEFTYEERFIDGLFGTLCRDGVIDKTIQRLKIITQK